MKVMQIVGICEEEKYDILVKVMQIVGICEEENMLYMI